MLEKINRTVVEKARCLLFDAHLDKNIWAEAVNTAVYIRNPSVAAGLDNRKNFQVWSNKNPMLTIYVLLEARLWNTFRKRNVPNLTRSQIK